MTDNTAIRATGAAATAPAAATKPAPIKALDQQHARPYDLASRARKVALEAPPLTPDTRDRLSVLLRGAA